MKKISQIAISKKTAIEYSLNMKHIYLLLLLFLLSPLSTTYLGHPVTYEKGIALNINTGTTSDSYLNYSYSAKKSIGLRYYKLNTPFNISFYLLQHNQLLKRWFFFDAQGNFYLVAAGGISEKSNTIVPCTKLLVDFENRRYFSSLQTELMFPQEATLFRIQSRLGWAPYKHNFTGIATWFMLQFEMLSFNETKTTVMPLYRGFYNQYLWEIGTNSVDYFIKLMVHI